jgi:hypothetical protein
VIHLPNCCGGGRQVSVKLGDKTVNVGAASVPSGSYAASKAWDRFDKLAKGLSSADTWIPTTGWADEAWAAFHAPSYCLLLVRYYQPETTPVHGAMLAWPAGVRPFATFGESSRPGQDPDDRIGTITPAAAYQLAASIADAAEAAGVPSSDLYTTPLSEGGRMTSPLIDDPDGGDPVTVYLWSASPGLVPCPIDF